MTIANKTYQAALNSHAPTEASGDAISNNLSLMKCVYDFATLGGLTGNIGLLNDTGGPAFLPTGAVVVRSWFSALTASGLKPPASTGSATVAAFVVSTADVLGATAIASLTGRVEGKQTGAVSLFTAAITSITGLQPSIAIATAPLSAGHFDVFLEYVIES